MKAAVEAAAPAVSPAAGGVAEGAACAGDRSARFAMLAGAAVVLAIGIPLSFIYNIWIDESFTLHTTGGGPLYAYAQSIVFEIQPPLYFVLESIWRLADPASVGFARIVSVAFAAATVAIMVDLARRVAPQLPPLAVAAGVALNSFVLWTSTELRVYAFALALAAVLTSSFVSGFLAERRSRRAQTIFALAAIAALYSLYYFAFVLVAFGATLLIVRPRALRAYLIASLVVAAAFAPFVPTVIRHFGARGEYVQHVGIVGVIKQVANAAFVFLLPHQSWWSGPVKIVGITAAVALTATLIGFGRPVFTTVGRGVVVAAWLALGLFSLVFVVTGLPIAPIRHLAPVFPVVYTGALVLVSSVTRRPRQLALLAAVVIAVFTVGTLAVSYQPPYVKVGDWRNLAATLVRDDRDGTPLTVFPSYLTLIFDRYVPSIPAHPIPGPTVFDLDYDARTTLHDTAEVARALDPLRARYPELWVATSGPCSTAPEAAPTTFDYHCMYLARYLAEHYREVRTIEFTGSQLSLYRRRSAR